MNLNSVLINDVEVIDHVFKYRLPNNNNIETEDVGSIDLLDTVFNVIPEFINGMSFVASRGSVSATEQYLFRGNISGITSSLSTIKLKIKGKGSIFQKAETNENYTINSPQLGVISAIASDIIESQGLTPNVVNSGTTNTINIYKPRREKTVTCLKELKNILRYECYFDHQSNTTDFEPREYVSSGVTLTIGELPVLNVPEWNEDDKDLFNQVIVEGEDKLVESSAWFDGNGSQTVFQLSKVPKSVKVWSGSNNFVTTRPTQSDIKKGGVENVTSDIDYTWSPTSKQITFQSGSIPVSGTNNIQVDFTYPEPVVAFLESEDSINTYSPIDDFGERIPLKRTFKVEDLEDLDDAVERATALINEFSEPKVDGSLEVSNDLTTYPQIKNLSVNNSIQIVDTASSIPRTITTSIKKIIFQYPETFDVIEVGDRKLNPKDVLERSIERIRKLENKQNNDEGVLLKVKPILRELTTQTFCREYKTDKTGDRLYYRDPDQGTWRNYKWRGNGTAVLNRVVHLLGNVYYEDFFDDIFFDSVNSTCDLDTANHVLSFSAGEFFNSEIIFKSGTSFSSVLWSLQNVVTAGLSDLTFSVCSRGKSVYPFDSSLNAKLYAGYKLDGDATDVLGSYDGTATNVTYGNGYYGQSGIFNGSTSKIELPFAPADFGDTICLCAWVKGDDTPTSNEGIIDSDVVSDNGTALIRDSSRKFRMVVTTTGGRVVATSTTQSTNGVWYHVLGTYDGANAKIYVNGVLEATEAVTGDQTGSIDFMIGRGRWDASANRYFDGLIDEAYVFFDLPSDDEIKRLSDYYFEDVDLGVTHAFVNQGSEGVVLKIKASNTASLDFSHPNFDKSNPWKVIMNG